jgi:NTE family protein
MEGDDRLEDGLGVCVSGGGYRAMLFHLGAFWYLSDAGILATASRVSSVSGGSITAAMLGRRWREIGFRTDGYQDRFRALVVEPVRRLAAKTIDVPSAFVGAILPGTISDQIVKHYDDTLYGGASLQELPDSPRFVINATNVQSGVLFRFSKPYLRDYRIGRIDKPAVPLSLAVAASSAFPPVLSPVRLTLRDEDWVANTGDPQWQKPPFTTDVELTDGGVYDNLGLETVWKRYRTVLVSDAGARMQPEPTPASDPVRHSIRVNAIIDNQVRSLRKRQVVAAFKAQERSGVYWGMWTNPDEYPVPSNLDLPATSARALAEVPTRLKKMDDELQERLINFGYGMAERAVRSHWKPEALPADAFPYPRGI